MAKKNSSLACPSCTTKLMEVKGHCEGIILVCPNCSSSILVDVDTSGRIRLSLEPVKDMPVKAERNVVAV